MRANIIIHSISGNLFIVARTFQEKLEERGIDARLYRVEDPDLHLEANLRNEVNEYYEDIIDLPVATNDKLCKADVVLIGTCSKFAQVTAEMKAFLDNTWPLYESRALIGKKFYGFASSPISKEDGKIATSGLYAWARQQGMHYIEYEPYIHKDGTIMPHRPSEEIDLLADGLANAIASSF